MLKPSPASSARVPLLVTLPATLPPPPRVPSAPMVTLDWLSDPLRCSTPPSTRVAPPQLLLPASPSTPLPRLTSPPAPLMSLPQVEVTSLKLAVTVPQSNRPGPCTALPTLSRPWPKISSTPGSPMSVAVPRMVWRTRSLLNQGNASHTRAAAPETCGAANEVPLQRQYSGASGASSVPVTTTVPGATRQ